MNDKENQPPNLTLRQEKNAKPAKILDYEILKSIHSLMEIEDEDFPDDPRVREYQGNVKKLLQDLVEKLDDKSSRNVFLEHEIIRLKRENVIVVLFFEFLELILNVVIGKEVSEESKRTRTDETITRRIQ
jgi:hypothetical protein